MASTKYTYSVSTDTLNAKADLGSLVTSVATSAIITALDYINKQDDVLDIWFKSSLSTEDQTLLTEVVHAHTGVQVIAPSLVTVDNKQIDVIPLAPRNDYDLKPEGMVKKNINASLYYCSISLSGKSGRTYTYNSDLPLVPDIEDAVSLDNWQTICYIESVDTTNHTITLEEDGPEITNGSGFLSKQIHIDYYLPMTPENSDGYWYLWGVYISVLNPGEDDFARLEIIDDSGNDLKAYDLSWVQTINKITRMVTPDGSPGKIPPTFGLRVDYYPTTATGTIKVFLDYILTVFIA
jgi:hypothetical protein